MFSARLYKLAALKVGVPDYKDQSSKNCKPPKSSTASWWTNSTKAEPSSSN